MVVSQISNNPQFHNVGNRGDVVKHRLLVDSIRLLAGAAGQDHTLIYVDTHAFAFRAPLPQENARFLRARAGCDLYHQIESQETTHTRVYLCSPGLAVESSRRFLYRKFIICERDKTLLGKLERQFARESELQAAFYSIFQPETLKEIVDQTCNPIVYMLVDPFCYQRDRQAVTVPIQTASELTYPAIVQLFNYGEEVSSEVFGSHWHRLSADEPPYYSSLAWNGAVDSLIDASELALISRSALL